jgi:hypothetical protein
MLTRIVTPKHTPSHNKTQPISALTTVDALFLLLLRGCRIGDDASLIKKLQSRPGL